VGCLGLEVNGRDETGAAAAEDEDFLDHVLSALARNGVTTCWIESKPYWGGGKRNEEKVCE
jgi:hypothetical protein